MALTVSREAGIEVAHLHWWFPAGMALWPSSVLGRVPTVVTSHGTDLFMLRTLAALRGPARAILRRAAAVTTVSQALASEVRALGLDPARVSVLPMPFDLETFGERAGAGEARDDDHVLFVGRLSEQKGVSDLLHAIALLASDRPALRLRVIGDGAERARLERQAETLGIATRTRFDGARSTADVAAAYRRATVLAVPSTTGAGGEREGFGLVAVEAMLAGLPVVATATGGLVDIVQDGDTGLLVPERQPERLALAIGRLLDDRIEREAIAGRARASASERFAPRGIAARYVALYERVAQKPPGGRASR
jgi:glycosyltransferase involved in cell wall biosynthesis